MTPLKFTIIRKTWNSMSTTWGMRRARTMKNLKKTCRVMLTYRRIQIRFLRRCSLTTCKGTSYQTWDRKACFANVKPVAAPSLRQLRVLMCQHWITHATKKVTHPYRQTKTLWRQPTLDHQIFLASNHLTWSRGSRLRMNLQAKRLWWDLIAYSWLKRDPTQLHQTYTSRKARNAKSSLLKTGQQGNQARSLFWWISV